MRITLLLAATVAIRTDAACTQCAFTDASNSVLSTCSANNNHRLHCAGTDRISSGAASFDNIACSGTEWFGLSCDGKVASLGASVAVSCPLTCGTTCASVATTDPAQAPIDDCFDDKHMKSCADGDLTIQTGVDAVAFSKAVCIGNNDWLALNCDGTVKKIAGPLNATCGPAKTCDTTGTPANSVVTSDAEGRAAVKCAIGDPWLDTYDIDGFTCENGGWIGTSGGQLVVPFGDLPSFQCEDPEGVLLLKKIAATPVGASVTIKVTWSGTTRFNLNLRTDYETHATTMSVRPSENACVFGARLNEAWGTEERTGIPFGAGALTIVITLQESTIEFTVNGALVKSFSSRISNTLIKRLLITGGVTLTSVV